jgi:hypothetical protein
MDGLNWQTIDRPSGGRVVGRSGCPLAPAVALLQDFAA